MGNVTRRGCKFDRLGLYWLPITTCDARSTVMVYDPKADNTVIILTNLAAVPATGDGSALQILKAVIPVLYGSAAGVPGGDPAAVPGAPPARVTVEAPAVAAHFPDS